MKKGARKLVNQLKANQERRGILLQELTASLNCSYVQKGLKCACEVH